MIGHEHHTGQWKPDLTCYHLPAGTTQADFIDNRLAYVVGVVEMKWANDCSEDLPKLVAIQSKHRTWLGWVVYGDHFREDVHRANYGQHLRRAKKIQSWVAGRPALRGSTIVKAGVEKRQDSRSQRGMRRDMNRDWWRRDRHSTLD